jgi:hypothetical protein
MKPPFDTRADFYRWGPIQGKYFYAAGDSVDSYFHDTVKRYAEAWPDSLWLARDGKVIWLTEFAPIRKHGIEIFLKEMAHPERRAERWAEWKDSKSAAANIEYSINESELSKMTDAEISNVARDFYDILVRYWSPTYFSEIGNYGAETYLEEKLVEIIQSRQEVLRIMEIITAPERLSFYQREEVELSQTSNIGRHQKKYFWLKNSHAHVEVIPTEYFAKRKEQLLPDLKNTVARNLESTKQRKVEAQREFNIPNEIMDIARLIGEGIYWQDDRKMNTFISLHYKYLLLQEVSRRTGIIESDLFNIHLGELSRLIGGEDLSEELQKRRNGVGAWCTNSSVMQLSQKEVAHFWDLYAEEKNCLNEHDGTIGRRCKQGDWDSARQSSNTLRPDETL